MLRLKARTIIAKTTHLTMLRLLSNQLYLEYCLLCYYLEQNHRTLSDLIKGRES